MTPRQLITVEFSEIKKVEITCKKCGAALVFPIPTEKDQQYLLQNYSCPGCGTRLWGDGHDDLYSRLLSLILALGQWQYLTGQGYSLSFSLDSK